MAYPGNPDLSPQAQDRVMSAFKQVVDKLQQGNREEALIGLEFVLRLDPAYGPALNLREQLASGAAEIDLNEVVSQLQAPTTDSINNLVVEAVEDFNNRDFQAAREKVEQVLLDLPGHEEARALLAQIEEAGKESPDQVGDFLAQAGEALAAGNSQEAANFVMMAQALDPHHPGIAKTITEIEKAGGMSMEQAGFVADPAATQKITFDAPSDDGPEFAAADTAGLFAEAPVEGAVAADTVPDFEPPAPADEAPPAVDEPAPAAGPPTGFATQEPYYDSPGDNVSDLFETGPTTFEDQGDEAVDPDDAGAAIRALLAKGGEAAAADRYAEAIDSWSRVLLIDHTHEEALDRIGHIRHAMEDLERRIDPMLSDAAAALESGDVELAKDFVDRVLTLWPNHVEATRLKEKVERGAPSSPAADAAPEPEMPELEDDLFSDEFAATTDFGAEVAKTTQTIEGEWRTPDKPKRRIPWQWWVAIGSAAAFIITISMWVAGVFAPKEVGEARITVVNRVLVEASELYNLKKIDEAILLLEQNSADDQFQVRIDNRLNEYRKMVATPVPTPVPEGLAACRSLVAENRWLAAYERVMLELQIAPNDPSLEAVRTQILEAEPDAANLYRAMETDNYRAALGITRDLFERYPEDTDLDTFYDRFLFNAGLSELRAFNLPEAEVFLSELRDRQPDDEEVPRMLEFIDLYKARPVDMQLEIFVGSIDLR